MSTVTPKSVVRNAAIGFALGLVLMLGVGYGAAFLTGPATTSSNTP
jgi:hypothetical protein